MTVPPGTRGPGRVSHFRFPISVFPFLFALVLGFGWSATPHAQSNAAPQATHAAMRFAFGGNAAHIPVEFLHNLIFVPTRVNDSKTSLFELDTTVRASSIDPGRLMELGLTLERPPVLDFPGVEVPLAALPAIAKKDFAANVGRPYQGTLGGDLFCCAVMEISYWRQTLLLYDPGVYKYSGKGASLPLTFHEGVPVVHAKFALPEGKIREADFAVDTTLDASIVFSGQSGGKHGRFSSHMHTVPFNDLQLNGGEVVAMGRLKGFQLGPYWVVNPIVEFSQAKVAAASESNAAGVIGGGLLRRFTVIFDFPHQRMIVDANLHIREDEQEDKSGLTIVAGGPGLKRLEVVRVQPGTPGSDAKIQKGDVIEGVDDEAVADMTLDSLRDIFRQPAGQHKLLMSRNGQTVQVTIKLRQLI